MRDTVIRSLVGAESALSSAAYNLTAHGRRLSIADVQDMNEHIDELRDLLRAFQQLVDDLQGRRANIEP